MTNIIDKLEADGLVRRVPHAEDRRATLAEITDAGARPPQARDRGPQRRVLRHRRARRRAISSASPTILRGLRLDAGDFTP